MEFITTLIHQIVELFCEAPGGRPGCGGASSRLS